MQASTGLQTGAAVAMEGTFSCKLPPSKPSGGNSIPPRPGRHAVNSAVMEAKSVQVSHVQPILGFRKALPKQDSWRLPKLC